jgi:hypothetical protein
MENLTSESPSTTAQRSKLDSLVGKLGTDALLLGALSALGYCVALAYEAGYASHFGYPSYLITPTPNVIVTALAAILMVVFGFVLPLVDLFESPGGRNKGIAALIVLWFVLAGSYLFTVSNYALSSLVTFGLSVAIFCFLQWAGAVDAKQGRVTGRKAKSVSGVLLLVSTVYVLASFFGTLTAMNQKAFFFLKSKPDFAVVRLYDSVAVAVRFDFQTQQFTREYLAFKMGDELKELNLVRTVLKGVRQPVVKDD